MTRTGISQAVERAKAMPEVKLNATEPGQRNQLSADVHWVLFRCRVERVSADPRFELVAEVNQRAGTDLQVVGVAEHGQSGGAAFVRWPDGRDGVVSHSPLQIEDACRTADVLAAAKSAGLPVPHHELLVELAGGGIAVVQERLPGRPASRTDTRVIEAMLAVNEQFAGLLAERTDIQIPPLFLRESGPIVPRHEVLEGYNDRSRRLLSRIHQVGAAKHHEMEGNDLVHPDFTVPNVLFDDAGQISGVVDWNLGAARGDRHWALIKLRFDLTWAAASPGGEQTSTQQDAIERVDRAIDSSIDPDLLQTYWAHWTLVQLHWAILHQPAEVIDLHLELGESRLT
jgi:aminoglycoside phosphotransferase (APT) family kinase protein